MIPNLQSLSSEKHTCTCSESTELVLDFRCVCPNCCPGRFDDSTANMGRNWPVTWSLHIFHLFLFTWGSPEIYYRRVCIVGLSLKVLQSHTGKFNLAVSTWMKANSISNQVNGSLAIVSMHIKSSILNLRGHARLKYRTTSDSLTWLSVENGLLFFLCS